MIFLAFKFCWDFMVISIKVMWFLCVKGPVGAAKFFHEWRGDSANAKTARNTQAMSQMQAQQLALQQQQFHDHQRWLTQHQWQTQQHPPQQQWSGQQQQPPQFIPPQHQHQTPAPAGLPPTRPLSHHPAVAHNENAPNQIPRSYRREPFWQAPPRPTQPPRAPQH